MWKPPYETIEMLNSYYSNFTISRRKCLCDLLVRQHHGQQDRERPEGGREVPEVVVVEEVEDDAVAAHAARGRGRDGRRVVCLLCINQKIRFLVKEQLHCNLWLTE